MSISLESKYLFTPVGYLHFAIQDQIEDRVGRLAAYFFNLLAPWLFCFSIEISASLFLVSLALNPIVELVGSIALAVLFFYSWAKYLNALGEYAKKDIEGMQKNSEKNLKKSLIVETADWHAGSDFSIKGMPKILSNALIDIVTISSLRKECRTLKKSHAVSIIREETEEKLLQTLDKIHDKSIEILMISGHGNRNAVSLGKNFDLRGGSRILMEKIARKVKDRALVYFNSCSTGAGDYNIARTFSTYCPTATVYAPTKPISPIHSKCINPPTYVPEFCSEGFFAKKIEGKVYQNGIEKKGMEIRACTAA